MDTKLIAFFEFVKHSFKKLKTFPYNIKIRYIIDHMVVYV